MVEVARGNCIFTNDNKVCINLFEHEYTYEFSRRDHHEVLFRRIHSFLIQNGIIKGNIIDLGAWIGDNSIPWAKQTKSTIYAIDPSPKNIDFINRMCKYNGITNVVTIQKPISDMREIISTDNDLHHCSFNPSSHGTTVLEAVSLDYLYENGDIDNIGYIHLDVEGFEFKVIKGCDRIIEHFHPIITFEQHLDQEDYQQLSSYIHGKGYNIFMINEVLPGCNYDCRNLIAFPNKLRININQIHDFIGTPVLLPLIQTSQVEADRVQENPVFLATLYGEYMSGKEYKNVRSVKVSGDLYVFAVNDGNYIKIVAIDRGKTWQDARYLLGRIDLRSNKTVINAYVSAYGRAIKHQYNIKNIRMVTVKNTEAITSIKILFYGDAHHKIEKNLLKGFRLLNLDYSTSGNIEDFDLIYSAKYPLDITKYPKQRFIFGAQFSVFPEHTSIFNDIYHNAIYIQPSEWTLKVWRDEFGYRSLPIKVCPVGVDTEEFKPNDTVIKDRVFIYYKRRKASELDSIKHKLTQLGYTYEIVVYGHYNEEDYKSLLDQSKFGIWLDAHESQGFALLEALSKNVPLLVWNVERMSQEEGSPEEYQKIETEVTSIPYWDHRCGEFFYRAEEFGTIFDKFRTNLDNYNPREFILETLELTEQTKKFLSLI